MPSVPQLVQQKVLGRVYVRHEASSNKCRKISLFWVDKKEEENGRDIFQGS
jgi:hypothetical protein